MAKAALAGDRATGATSDVQRRRFLLLVKGSIRAPTVGVQALQTTQLAKIMAHVATHPELRRQLERVVPPILAASAEKALSMTKLGASLRMARDLYDKFKPKD